jgi:hypothetical protein
MKEMDERTRNQIIILLLGVLIGAAGYLANSLFLWNASMNKERSDIAEGIFLDVSSLEGPLMLADQEFQTPGDDCDDFVFVQSNPLYPDNGLYYAYQRDIPKINRKIATDTFMFYDHLLSAERDRKLIFEIERQGDLRNLTPAEVRRQQILTKNVAREINISVSLLPAMKQELNAAT